MQVKTSWSIIRSLYMYGSPSTRPVVRSSGCDFRFKGSGISARSKLSSEANDLKLILTISHRQIISSIQMMAEIKIRTDLRVELRDILVVFGMLLYCLYKAGYLIVSVTIKDRALYF